MRFQYGTLRLAFRLTVSAAAVAMAVGGQNAFAFNTLTFETPGADKDLRAVLGNASLLLAAEKEKTTDPQDLLAAAQGEYGRLLGALYAEGYYSGVIHITLDGSEAANIPALLGKILKRYERDYERDKPGLVSEALALLWAARRGLTEPELPEELIEKLKKLILSISIISMNYSFLFQIFCLIFKIITFSP